MATISASTRNLVGTQSITFIKPMVVRVDVSNARPNTKLFPFFGGERIDTFCRQYIGSGTVTPVGAIKTIASVTVNDSNQSTLGSSLVTNSAGELIAFFYIPGNRFTTGNKEIIFSDTSDVTALSINGNVFGSARSSFKSQGTIETYQNVTTVTEIVVVQRVDPLAQSFFTYGVTGGLFITSIDLFFQSKDSSLPVKVELREMSNGFPKESSNNANLVSILNPDSINISNSGLVATKFPFPGPVYLEGDKDYCFVVQSNSLNYNIWTSMMGEKSVETGASIYEQPYTGSLFKSENNFTWTAQQFEDIKFTINKAQFDTSTAAALTFTGSMVAQSAPGTYFSTTSGSPLLIYIAPQMHGLTAGSSIKVNADTSGTFNGISGTNLSGVFPVTRIIDEYTAEFQAAANANASGKILSSGIVRAIMLTEKGSGYTSAPVVTIAAPTSGTTATATASISTNGQLVGIAITNPGSGYTSAPVVTIAAPTSGTTALAIASNDAVLSINVNKPMHVVAPQVSYSVVPNTSLTATIQGVSPSYGYLAPAELKLDKIKRLDVPSLVASRTNENLSLANAYSLNVGVTISSTNPNLSPVINLNDTNGLLIGTNAINSQATTESLTATISNSGLATVTITNGGSGYGSVPTVTVKPAENETGIITTTAVVTATLTSGVVTGLSIGTAGAGYTKPPLIVIAPPTSGTTATATSTINLINSELNTAGNAYSRYITKKISLANVSQGVRVFVDAVSTKETTFDWYIRTTLSGDSTKHEAASWKILKCDNPRNKSKAADDVIEYTFYLDGIPHFDTYDLKMVPSSTNVTKTPFIKKYRVIVLA